MSRRDGIGERRSWDAYQGRFGAGVVREYPGRALVCDANLLPPSFASVRRGIRFSIGFAASLVAIGGTCGKAGALVVSGNITFGTCAYLPGSNYQGWIDQLPTHNQDATGVFFEYTPADLAPATLQCVNTVLDEGSDWYLASLGQTFSQGTILSGQFTSLPPMYGQPLEIPSGDFYLAVNTGRGYTGNKTNRDIFGWVELENTGSSLIAVDSAVAYGETGIVVGVTGATPEPGSLGALGIGGLLLLRRIARGGIRSQTKCAG
jgi:hypothetical protein